MQHAIKDLIISSSFMLIVFHAGWDKCPTSRGASQPILFPATAVSHTSPVAKLIAKNRALGMSEGISGPERHTGEGVACTYGPALRSSPWEPCPLSPGELSAQDVKKMAAPLVEDHSPDRGVCLHGRAPTFSPCHRWNIYNHNLSPPLINYPPATGWRWIINMHLISISPIDFCHCFQMDILDGVFSPFFLLTSVPTGGYPSWRLRPEIAWFLPSSAL